MTDDEWRWFQLSISSKSLPKSSIIELEEQLQKEPGNLDIIVQLFSYYRVKDKNKFIHKDAEKHLFELTNWLIKNKPDLDGWAASELLYNSYHYSARNFGRLRTAWLETVESHPTNANVISNAAVFIYWRDIETADPLFERALTLNPKTSCLSLYSIALHFDMIASPLLYQHELCNKLIKIGTKAIENDHSGFADSIHQYVADAALTIGDLDLVEKSALSFRHLHPAHEQMTNSYLGLVALRKNQIDLAKQLLAVKPDYDTQNIALQLAMELCKAGERECIVEFINGFGEQFDQDLRPIWLRQLANNETPDFMSYNKIKTKKMKRTRK